MKIETYARTAALFLTIVFLVGLYARHNHPGQTGYWAAVLDDTPPLTDCFDADNREIIAQINRDGSLTVHNFLSGFRQEEQTFAKRDMSRVVEQLQRFGTDTVFIRADSEIEYQEVIDSVASLKTKVPSLNLVIVHSTWRPLPCSLRIREAAKSPLGFWPRELEPPELHSK